MNVRSASILAALLLVSAPAASQAPGVLRVTITLLDATQTAVPVARHALLISDNPPTREPRRLVTTADGTIVVNLAPGSYIVESDRPAAFDGKGYQWTMIVDVVSGRDTALALTAQNADIVALSATTPEREPTADVDPVTEIGKWQASVVTIWSPTAKASGFVVDARGLVATDRHGVGGATSVEVQLSPAVKVPARVIVAEPAQDVAIVLVDPTVLKAAVAVPLVCGPGAPPSLDLGREIVAMTASPGGVHDVVTGEITGFHPRGIETDLRLAPGDSGGPVFAGDRATVVGLTSIATDEDASRGDVRVVRAGILCESVSAARTKMSSIAPPEPTPLPVEPTGRYPTDSASASSDNTSSVTPPPVVSSANFEVAFVTPPRIVRARARADWTGGRSGRSEEAEARLGRLTDFGPWADYFADVPPVLVIRVTPKLVEGFWLRLAREAARAQGAAIPPLQDFKVNFLRLHASCGGRDVIPIHPFVLEHAVGDRRVLREGLYVFGPEVFGPHCGSATLSITSEQAPDKAEAVTLDSRLLAQIWEDFAAYRQRR